METKLVRSLRWLGFVEGASMLLLLFVAMPMKYVYGRPEWVRVVGMAHGLLFMAFVVAVTVISQEAGWARRRLLFAFVASVVPFGPFLLDRKIFTEAESPRT